MLVKRYNPKKPVLPLLLLHFKVLILVAAPSRCVSRFCSWFWLRLRRAAFQDPAFSYSGVKSLIFCTVAPSRCCSMATSRSTIWSKSRRFMISFWAWGERAGTTPFTLGEPPVLFLVSAGAAPWPVPPSDRQRDFRP